MVNLAWFAGLAMQISAQSQPPQILQIYRDFLKSGSHTAYQEVERDIAGVCVELGFPHAYLAIEPLTGPQEVWFLNAWESEAEQKQVAEDYASNGPLAAALESKGKQKARLTSGHVNVFVHYRRPLSGSAPWNMGLARFSSLR